jgi:hypothetical protein
MRPVLGGVTVTMIFAASAVAAADGQMILSGEVRLRDEIRLHLYAPTDALGRAQYEEIHLRARLRADATVNEYVAAIVEVQDVRVLGEAGSTTADDEGVDLRRGQMIIDNIGDRPVAVEAGRFVLKYGDQRLIGDLEWLDQGRTYDGLRLSLHPEGFFLDGFFARVRETTVAGDDQTLFGIYSGATRLGGASSLEAYAIGFEDKLEAMGEAGLADTLFVTLGTRAAYAAAPIDATVELAMQVGELQGDDLLAWAAALRAGYTWSGALAPRVGGELAYARGDNADRTDGRRQQFQTLFPTNHLHYGYADVAAWTNLAAARLSVSAKPQAKWLVTADWHHLRLANESGGWVNAAGQQIRAGLDGAARHLGDELDLLVSWKPVTGLDLLAGWSRFVPGGFVADTGGGDAADFAYLQAGVAF